MIGYAYPNGDGSYALFYDVQSIPDSIRTQVEQMIIPEGYGILRKKEDGSFYYESLPSDEEPPIIEQPTEPEPTETLEEKISRLFTVTEQNNLITVDAVLGVYEELIALHEEVAALKGTSNNA